MVQEDIIVKIKAINELRGLVQARTDLQKLRQVGVVPTSKGFEDLNGRFVQTSVAVKKASRVFGRFKAELLSVLFFGMAINRFLTGLLKPAFDIVGVFDILNFILTDLFLITGSKVADLLLAISDKFGELRDPTKEIIGDFVLLFTILSLLLFLFGIFGLGLVGIGQVFGISAGAAAIFAGGIFLLAGLIFGFIVLMKNWEKISTKFKIIIGAVAIVLGVLAIALGAPILGAITLILGAFVLLRAGWDELTKSLGTTGFVDTIKAAFNKIIDIINKFLNVVNKIPGINIPGLQKFQVGTPEDVIRVSEEVSLPPGATPGGGFKVGDSFFNITINTTNGIDEVSLKDELKNFINETNATGIANISRR